MYLATTTTITAPSLCRINIKNNVLDITVTLGKNSLAIPQILLLDTNYNFRLTNMFGLQNSQAALSTGKCSPLFYTGESVSILEV